MNRKIRISKQFLFEKELIKLRSKYWQHMSESELINIDINSFSDNVPYEYKQISDEPFIPGMFRVYHKSERIKSLKETIKPKLKFSKSLPIQMVENAFWKNIELKKSNNNYQFKYYKLDNDNIAGIISIAIPIQDIHNGVVEHLEKLMEIAGYYCRTHGAKTYYNWEPDYKWQSNELHVHWWQFEPYEWGENYQTIEDIIYHVTSIKNSLKIQEEGFIAHYRNDANWIYPPRNYFFNKLDPIKFKRFAIANNKINIDNQFATIFTDTTLNKNIKFYSDPNYIEANGIYTYDNIDKSTIIKVVEDKTKINDK